MALGVDCRGRCRWSRTWRYLESLDFHGDIGISRFRTIHASANPRSCTSWKPRALPETLGRERGPQTLSSACHLRTRRGPEALSVSLCLSLSRNRKNGRSYNSPRGKRSKPKPALVQSGGLVPANMTIVGFYGVPVVGRGASVLQLHLAASERCGVHAVTFHSQVEQCSSFKKLSATCRYILRLP